MSDRSLSIGLVALLFAGCAGEEADGNATDSVTEGTTSGPASGPTASNTPPPPVAPPPTSTMAPTPIPPASTTNAPQPPQPNPVPTPPATTQTPPTMPVPTPSVVPTEGQGGGGAMDAGGSGGVAAGSGGMPQGGAGAAGTGGMGGTAGAGNAQGCDNPAYLLCEDFETTDEGQIPDNYTLQGEAAVASDQARSGTRSLKIGQADNGPRRIAHDASNFGSAHWGRIFYRVQTPVPAPFVHSTMIELQGDGPNIGSAGYRVVDTVKDENGMHQFLYNVQPSGAEFGTGSSYDWEFDGEWHCAEWHIDGGNQSYHFYYDSEEVTDIAIDNGAGNYDGTEIPPEGFEEIRVGWYNYQEASPGFVVWLDDLAISADRVGCE